MFLILLSIILLIIALRVALKKRPTDKVWTAQEAFVTAGELFAKGEIDLDEYNHLVGLIKWERMDKVSEILNELI